MATFAHGPTFEPSSSIDGATAERFLREAQRFVEEALRTAPVLHEPGRRDAYRLLLERGILHANQALGFAGADAATVTAARSTLVRAHTAKAEDALHGARQLSLSAQRAPTRDACDDGWRRVEAIYAGAEASARSARRLATELEEDAPASAVARAAQLAASKAEASAHAARKLVAERNHAYTFHTDGGFSFGEGWYLAAAGVLAGVAIQIEPSKDGTPQAERFLRDAGLAGRLQPYRPRPRAMKQTTELIARAFEADPVSARTKLRAAFLGDAPISNDVSDWVDRRMCETKEGMLDAKKVLLWIRDGVHHPRRNTAFEELLALTACVQRAGLVPVWTGDAPRGERPDGVIDLILFWKDPVFRQTDMRLAQLQFFEHLRRRHGLVGQLGVTTAGMDGPALMGLPTIYLTDAPNVRMREWVGAVPNYQEVVRESGYLARVFSACARMTRQ